MIPKTKDQFIQVCEADWHYYRKKLGMIPRSTIELTIDDGIPDRETYEKFFDNPPTYMDQVQGFRVDGFSSCYFLASDVGDVAAYDDRQFPIGADTVVLYANCN